MKSLLDEIFDEKIYTKKILQDTTECEPDYYTRDNNTIFLFENKDVLVAKEKKSSGDITQIEEVLASKFNQQSLGIGQLVNTIKTISEQNFKFDDYVNSKNRLTIYPILIVHDRLFQCPGINYKLNQWFVEKLKEIDTKGHYIKSLLVIDIDTLICYLPYLKNKNNLISTINNHLKAINPKKPKDEKKINWELIENTIKPIGDRIQHKISTQLVSDIFEDLNLPRS